MCEGCGCDVPKENPEKPKASEAGHWHVHADGTVHRHDDDHHHDHEHLHHHAPPGEHQGPAAPGVDSNQSQ